MTKKKNLCGYVRMAVCHASSAALLCMLSLGIYSCDAHKGNTCKPEDGVEYSDTTACDAEDTLRMNLRHVSFSQGNIVQIQYRITNATRWYYTFLPDEYWIEKYEAGKWARVQSDIGSILMGKEIPSDSSIEGSVRLSLRGGVYRFCNTVYADDARIGDKKIILKSEFTVKP